MIVWLLLGSLELWAQAPCGDLPLTVGLADGTAVAGQWERQWAGLFLHTPAGGRLYRWDMLAAASLPAEWQAELRAEALALLAVADARYADGDIPGAQPLYQQVYERRGFLTPADRSQPTMAELEYRRRGWVRHEGQWVTYARQQELLGNVLLNGRWVTRAEAAEYQAFAQALAALPAPPADPMPALLVLQGVIARYPASPYRVLAEQARDRALTVWRNPPPAPPVVAQPRPEEVIDYVAIRRQAQREAEREARYDAMFDLAWERYQDRRPNYRLLRGYDPRGYRFYNHDGRDQDRGRDHDRHGDRRDRRPDCDDEGVVLRLRF
jgi:hypothetical protein